MTTDEAMTLRKWDAITVRMSGRKRQMRAVVMDAPHWVDKWVLVPFSYAHADSYDSDIRSGYHVAVIGQDQVARR